MTKHRSVLRWLITVLLLIAVMFYVVAAFYQRAKFQAMYGAGKLTTPVEAQVDLRSDVLNKFDDASKVILLRYLTGNPAWSVREEGGKIFAVRRDDLLKNAMDVWNGYYQQNDRSSTRVLISFETMYGFGNLTNQITRCDGGTEKNDVVIKEPHYGFPGYTSYVIIRGNRLFLEIYEQGPQPVRNFTRKAYEEVCKELECLREHIEEVDKSGILNIPSLYPVALPKSPRLEINNGMQPGIYTITASVNPKARGKVFVRVFDATSNTELSAKSIKQRSMRVTGWSDDGETYFPYEAECTVYERGFESQRVARFELWHESDTGKSVKLNETTRSIRGWQR